MGRVFPRHQLDRHLPHQTHHGRKALPAVDDPAAWRDLQLPLYAHLVRRSGLSRGMVQLGYVVLPKEPEGAAFASAQWTDEHLDTALDVAGNVVADIRARCVTGDFAPNPDAASPWDAYARICQTNVFADTRRGDEDALDGDSAGGGTP